MSIRIGAVRLRHDTDEAAVHVLASSAGVEIHSDPLMTLSPGEAREYAAFLVGGASWVDSTRRSDELAEFRNGVLEEVAKSICRGGMLDHQLGSAEQRIARAIREMKK